MQVQKARKGYKKVKWLFGKETEIPEEWEILKLSKSCEKENDIVAGPFGSNLMVSDYTTNGVPIIRLQNIDRNQFIEKNIKFINKEKAEELKYHSYIPEDLVLAKLGDPIGKTCKIPKDFPAGIVVADVVRIRTSPKKSDRNFVEYVLNSWICAKQFDMERIGTTRPRVNLKQIRDLIFPCPPKQEQQKIASILSNVDSLINQTQKEIEQTQKLKKGLMQRLLARGIGHTKFKKVKWLFDKEIEIPEKWNRVKIEEIAIKLVSGGTPSTTNLEFWNGDIPWTKGAILTQHYVDKGERFITSKGLENSSSVRIPKNNLLVASRVSMGNLSINKIDIAINQDVTGIIIDKSKIFVEYMYWYLLKHIQKLTSFSQGSTIQGFTRKELSKFLIALPPIQEQQKIASILSNVDSQIQKHQEYKSNLESLKKGLMQKLLTGQIRVKV